MTIRFRELCPGFVGEVSGIDLTRPFDEAAAQALRDGIARYGVLVFHDQELSDEQQILVARRFGPPRNAAILDGKIKRQSRLALPQLVDLSNLDPDGKIRERDDRQRMSSLGNQLWHTDSSFEEIRAAYSLLSARAVPESGSETNFADLRGAYDDLLPAMKAKLEGLVAEHSLMHSRSVVGVDWFTPEQYASVPPVHWPVVETHVPSGRKTLYLASHASHIVGWPIPEGRVLLLHLIDHATQPDHVYQHFWRKGDLVIWDNRCTMHRVRPFDESEARDVRRVSTMDLPGDAGRVEALA